MTLMNYTILHQKSRLQKKITEMLHRHADKIDMESTFTVTEKARKKATTIIFPIFFFLFVPLLAIILLPTFDIIINQI